jgi:hypothetical protein
MEDKNTLNSLSRLAYFEPNFEDEYGNQVLDYLVIDSLSVGENLFHYSSSEIKKNIKDSFTIDFALGEIISSAKRLLRKGYVEIINEGEKDEELRFKLLPNITNEVINKQKSISEIETNVFDEWRNELNDKYKNITKISSNIDVIVNSFKTFLVKLFVRHGIESVSILYPNDEKSQLWISTIQGNIINDLPKVSGELNIILEIEIPNFFKSKNPQRKKYLDSIFNASYYWHLTQIDDKCTEYFKNVSEGQFLIMDNNILFSLMGFHGANCMESVHELLNYANNLGYVLTITTKTIDEFYESLKRNGEKHLKTPRYSKALAEVAIKTLDSNNFMVTYWKEFVDKRLTLNEFIIEKSHLEKVLKNLNIELISDFREEIEKSEELKNEESILRSTCGDFPQQIIEHDAFHNILVKKIRKEAKHKYSQAVCWFLTHDTKLPVYARASLKGKKTLPFCITTNEWIQINRPFIRRTANNEEFEESFTNLVTQPYLRTILASFKVSNIQEKILNNLSRYKSCGKQLAFEMVTDVQFLNVVSNSSNHEFDEKVESKIVELNKILQEENQELYSVLDESSKEYYEEINYLKEDINELRSELNSKSTTIEILNLKVEETIKRRELSEQERDELSNKSKKEFSEKENLENELTIIKKEYKSFKKKVILWFVFFILLLITSIALWSVSIPIEIKKIIPFKILINLILVFSFINIPLSKNWSVWLPLIVACLITLLMLIN